MTLMLRARIISLNMNVRSLGIIASHIFLRTIKEKGPAETSDNVSFCGGIGDYVQVKIYGKG
jgi:hypothetical protein